MNIKITYNWLREYLETDADPYELQKYLSLSGPGVERVDKVGDDYVLDIEITTNRVDMASVFGIAQEAQAILPRFGKIAKLKQNPLTELKLRQVNIQNNSDAFSLTVEMSNVKLAPQLMLAVLSVATIGQSPEKMKHRLELCGIRSINSAVDVTNYIMLALGQPAHVFDYDRIEGKKMIIRESKKGETLVTLDGKKIILPGDDIVIEDGSGNLIDLCGIMGGTNSAINENTKNLVLFIQTYDKQKIRKTSMITGQRSVAATYFEKGLDEERVEPAFVYGLSLLTEFTGAKVVNFIHKFGKPRDFPNIRVSPSFITNRIGVDMDVDEIQIILENLGFSVSFSNETLNIGLPFWRVHDIKIPEDIVEEIARIYGYHNLPNTLPPPAHVVQPSDVERLFTYQTKIKYFLKHIGIHETMNYSMVSEAMITSLNIDPRHHLKLTNTNSEELQYMRISLLPSLIKNVRDNTGKRDVLRFFELSKVYYPHQNNPNLESCPPGFSATHGLPTEVWKLAVATNTSFEDAKGIMEALMSELHITEYELRKGTIGMFAKNVQVDFVLGGKTIGTVGQLSPRIQVEHGLKGSVYLAGFDLQSLIDHAKLLPIYKPLSLYGTVKLDLTIEQSKRSYAEIIEAAKKASHRLDHVEYVGMYKNKLALRFYFSSSSRNLTEKEAAEELAKIRGAVLA